VGKRWRVKCRARRQFTRGDHGNRERQQHLTAKIEICRWEKIRKGEGSQRRKRTQQRKKIEEGAKKKNEAQNARGNFSSSDLEETKGA